MCYKQVPTNDQNSFCSNRHQRCSLCPESGCILCRLSQLRSWRNTSLDDLPADVHKTVEICDQMEKKFEELQSTNVNPILNREDSMTMDVDVNPIEQSNANTTVTTTGDCRICLDDLDATQVILPTCQHVFHQDCLKKWFESSGKQSCPTCGYLYGILKGISSLIQFERLGFLFVQVLNRKVK